MVRRHKKKKIKQRNGKTKEERLIVVVKVLNDKYHIEFKIEENDLIVKKQFWPRERERERDSGLTVLFARFYIYLKKKASGESECENVVKPICHAN